MAQVKWQSAYDKHLLASVFTPYLIVHRLTYPSEKNNRYKKDEKVKIPLAMMKAIEAQAKIVIEGHEEWDKFKPKLHRRFSSGKLTVRNLKIHNMRIT